MRSIMKTLLTSDSRNFFHNPLMDFEHESLMSKMDKKKFEKATTTINT